MFAGQKPDPSWPYALPQPDDPGPSPEQTESVGARSSGVPSEAARSHTLPIVLATVLALAALASIGFVGTLVLRPAEPLKTAAPAPLPALVSAISPLGADASNSLSQMFEPEPRSGAEPAPIQFGVSQEASLEAPPPAASATPALGNLPLPPAATDLAAPLPPPRPLEFAPPRPLEFAPSVKPAMGYDKWTAVYDISAHSVYLPDGTRLEAHSGLGDRLDDPRYVDERDHGATPPNLYELTLRESLFHGVQALRLTPIGEGLTFDRVGLLAHPYMLGPNGDSNGCVSFKDYDAFLRAFQSGEVKRLAVVARLAQEPPPVGRVAILRLGPDR
jgi:hypothetical protein